MLLLVVGSSADALAQPILQPAPDVGEAISISGRATPRGFIEDRAVIPGYWDVGTSVTFASASGASADSGLDLPSVARLGLQGRLALGESFEVSSGLLLPPKRDEVTDDPPVMGGHLMTRWAVHRRQALYMRASADRLLQVAGPRDDGMWAEAAAGWDGRSFMDRDRRWLAFSWNLGVGAGRALGAGGDTPPWLVEGIAGIGLQVRMPLADQGLGLALGSDFRFPFADGGNAYWTGDAMTINSQTRVDLYSSLFVTLATGWSITATWAYRDRGEADSPETILPTLGGGYDQTQFVIGFSYSGIREREKPAQIAQ